VAGRGALGEWARSLRARDEAERAHPLSRHIGERRDLTTTAGAGGDFVPAGSPPIFIADEFARAARNASMLLGTLGTRPLPETGMKLEVPRLATGASAAVQNRELSLVSETDPTTVSVSSPLSTIAGLVDASRQVFDRALPGLDLVIAAELGAAMGQQIDVAAIQGTGTNGQTRGLLNVSGTVSVTHTDASPSVGEQVAKAWQAYAVVADTAAGGYGTANPDAYLTIVHPRRYAFLKANQSGQTTFELPGEVAPSAGVPTNLGAGTNEDRIIVLDRNQSFVAAAAPKFEVHQEPLSGVLGVRLRAHCYLAAMFGRQPTSIAVVSGTGLVTPTWPA
jgi:Phage capsid family